MYYFNDADTIAAISTAMGDAGIGIVRLSGDGALDIAQKIFLSKNGKLLKDLRTHSLCYGWVIDPVSSQPIDEVLVSVMRAPHTYTTQDIVEINSHGGGMVTRTVLQAVLRAGARMAEPGEFTKRAFLGGRLDLTQAEAVMDIIAARSEKGLILSVNQLNGGLKEKIDHVDAALVDLLSDIEANIDYPEYDIEAVSKERTYSVLTDVLHHLTALLKSLKVNRVYQEGIATAIIGLPNAGKSSLLNQLLQRDKAIVTEIPGTTRDVIEDYINIEGIPFKIIDTAGIRKTDDLVEKIGVERSLQTIDSADLILYIFDSSQPAEDADLKLMERLRDKQVIFIRNKTDLPSDPKALDVLGSISVSMKNGTGLENIRHSMVQYALKDAVQGDECEMTANLRQIGLIEKSVDFLKAAFSSVQSGLPLELISIDLQAALSSLREMTGAEIGSDIIDSIFSKFCLGK